MRVALCAISGLLAFSTPALATGVLECVADDRSVEFVIQAHFSYASASPIVQVRSDLKARLAGAPENLRSVSFEKSHLAHSWLQGGDIKMHLFRKEEASPSSEVEIILEARRKPNSETEAAGTYRLKMTIDRSSPKPRVVRASGRVSCSIG
jgi:hypothetical protein